jgi:hypothetical protein
MLSVTFAIQGLTVFTGIRPKQRYDVPRDPAAIGDQRRFLLGDLPPGQQPTGFNIGEVLPA